MKLVKKQAPVLPPLTLRDFYNKRNKVLIIRQVGGLGDILMHRMMFEDIKNVDPNIHITFACPKHYHSALKDHPFIDELIDNRLVCVEDYLISYNTSTACTRYELRVAPFSGEHRSDIWAWHCGVKLTNHNMHITIPEVSKQFGIEQIEKIREKNKPCIAVCPISAMVGKNLTDYHTEGLIKGLREMGCTVFGIHTFSVPVLKKLEVPTFFNLNIPDWMGLLYAADYVISVDSAAFHFAGGMGKPVLGIFTFADGKVYSKYYNAELVQKHRDNGDWDCGPCYNWANCPKSKNIRKPCLTELTLEMIMDGVKQMFKRWPFKNAIKLMWDTK